MRSPVERSMSSSRRGGLVADLSGEREELVGRLAHRGDDHDDVAAAARAATTRSATLRIRSTSATDEPPYFWTTIDNAPPPPSVTLYLVRFCNQDPGALDARRCGRRRGRRRHRLRAAAAGRGVRRAPAAFGPGATARSVDDARRRAGSSSRARQRYGSRGCSRGSGWRWGRPGARTCRHRRRGRPPRSGWRGPAADRARRARGFDRDRVVGRAASGGTRERL